MGHKLLEQGTVISAQGFTGGAVACGIKYKDRDDISLVYSEIPCAAAAVFTKNQVVAAPVIVDRETLAVNRSGIHGVLTNAGNANAATGAVGLQNGRQMQALVATAMEKEPNDFFVMSTGVIGVQLPMENVAQGIAAVAADLGRENGSRVAQAICTTDTFHKEIGIEVSLSSGSVIIGGTAKGAGMIHPDMATMLGLITTDAAVEPEQLQRFLDDANRTSFNRISVDGDTSTNDTVILLANGASGIAVGDDSDDIEQFSAGLKFVCTELAKMIVRDGEGASKFVELQVAGTETEADAHQIANSIAMSPLVKTAFAGSDANWGRIMMAAGKAGVTFEQLKTTLHISTDGETWLTLMQNGLPTAYQEADAAAIFAGSDIFVRLELAEGTASTTVWTCDLTHEYVSINADYRS